MKQFECAGIVSVIPADHRLSKEAAREINSKEQKETIEFQKRLLELEQQRELDYLAARRDSCNLYVDKAMIEG